MRKSIEFWNHCLDTLDTPGFSQGMAKPQILRDGEQERSCALSHYALKLTLGFFLVIYALKILKADLPALGQDDTGIHS
jgi:hypothetical protein